MPRLRYDSFDRSARHMEGTDMAPAIATTAHLTNVVPGGSAA
jgi:hypothetical protein